MNTTMTSGQMRTILELAEQKGVVPDHMTRVLASGILADIFDEQADFTNREAVRNALNLGSVDPHITVNYGMTLKQMIVAGQYDWANKDITAARFPINGGGMVESAAQLIHFNYDISSDGATIELDRMGLRPGRIEELLVFGATFPEMQRKFPIVALGSSCEIDGIRYVAFLGGRVSGRDLDLYWWIGGWGRGSRFLAFRKPA